MAITFPAVPAPNQEWTQAGVTWRWDTQKWVSQSPGGGGGGASVEVGETPPDPAGASEGDLFWSSTDTNLYILYIDDDGPQWVEASPGGGGGGAGDSFWIRASDTLSPANSGDDLNIGDGNFYANRGTFASSIDVASTITTGGDAEFDGSITAAGAISNTSYCNFNYDPDDSENRVSVGKPSGASGACLLGYDSLNDETFRIDSTDGSIIADNKIVINPDSVNASDDRTRLQIGEGAGTARELALLYTTDSAYQGPGLKIQHRNSTNNDAKFLECVKGTSTVAEIGLDGSITATGTIRHGASTTSNYVQLMTSGAGADKRGALVISKDNSSSGQIGITFLANGSTTSFIKYDGSTTFNLEWDDPTQYITTTNADGETLSVYNGPTLDVKDELQALRARATQQDAVIAQMVTALRSQGVTIETTDIQEAN